MDSYLLPIILAVAISTVFCRDPCWDIKKGRVLSNAHAMRSFRSRNIEQCALLCLGKMKCDRVVYNRLSRSCKLYNLQNRPGEEELSRSRWDSYAIMKEHCVLNNDKGSEKVQRSSVDPNLQNSGWQDWAAWAPCSSTCGSGTTMRHRSCKSYHTALCNGKSKETKTCQKGPCSQWNEWTQWTGCSVTCGTGARTRSRFCNTYYGCSGNRNERENCQPGTCNQWQSWGSWSACSKLCGGGSRSRARHCTTPGSCVGRGKETKDCNTQSCCAQWSQWSQCSVTCGRSGRDGVESRRRRCTIETKRYAFKRSGYSVGGYASKEEKEDRKCTNLRPCAYWSYWQAWSSCSVTCGGGERYRTRSCSKTGQCDGEMTETKSCHDEQCPGWRDWAQWTHCDATCGGGTKARTRQCSVTGQCQGDAVEEKTCNTYPCPEWTTWGAWSFCSHSCDGGWQTRARVCNQYNTCPGDSKEKQTCNEYECPAMEEWGAWEECSEPCGGGVQTRTRSCFFDTGFCQADHLETPSCQCDGVTESGKDCNTHKCASWTNWGSWGQCSSECDGGTRERKRTCEKDTSFCVGRNKNDPTCICDGGDSENGPCNDHGCAEWSDWGDWGQCSASCGVGAKERKRTCKVDTNYCNENNRNSPSCTCPGLDHSNDNCNTQLCPQWGHWGSWSECDLPCEGGSKIRSRSCKTDDEFCAENPDDASCHCSGDDEDFTPCNNHQCASWGQWEKWSECSKPCDGGNRYRTRKCNTDAGHCFGSALLTDPSCQCDGDEENEEKCNEFECPYWDEWTEWSDCSVTCSKGQKDRKRICITDDEYCYGNKGTEGCECDGNDVDVTKCDAGPCHQWSQWGAWSKCSQVCGGGSRNRARQCPVAGACPGLDEETDFCNQIPCPDWGSWSPWSSCSVSCGGGQRVRNRACPIEGGCRPGEPFEANECGMDTCPEWTKWSAWSHCDRSCGEGNRKRERVCQPINGCLGRGTDVEPCFDQACPLTTHWSAWSPCTETCGGGTQTRSRASCPSQGCPTEKENQQCSDITCPSWGTWETWSQCSKRCGAGSRTRNRLCVDTNDIEIPRGCVGKGAEIDGNPCNDIACF